MKARMEEILQMHHEHLKQHAAIAMRIAQKRATSLAIQSAMDLHIAQVNLLIISAVAGAMNDKITTNPSKPA